MEDIENQGGAIHIDALKKEYTESSESLSFEAKCREVSYGVGWVERPENTPN